MKSALFFVMAFVYSSGVFGATEVTCKPTPRFPYSVVIQGAEGSKTKMVTVKRKKKIVYQNKVRFHDRLHQKDFVSGRQFAMSVSKKNALANFTAIVREDGGRKMIADGHMVCQTL
jgi:hypothetical protein